MKTLGRVLWWGLRLLCYVTLLLFVVSIAILVVVTSMNLCETFNPAPLGCTSAGVLGAIRFAYSVILLGVFTGVPVLLALGGLVFLGFDVAALWRRCFLGRRSKPPPLPPPLPSSRDPSSRQ